MKRSIARKWAAALESGEYKQTQEKLRDKEGFCCVGVLCNLHAQEHPEIASKQTDPYEYLGQTGVAPCEVLHWSGMRDSEGSATTCLYETARGREIYALTQLNDDACLTFPEIAKIIRKHYKEL